MQYLQLPNCQAAKRLYQFKRDFFCRLVKCRYCISPRRSQRRRIFSVYICRQKTTRRGHPVKRDKAYTPVAIFCRSLAFRASVTRRVRRRIVYALASAHALGNLRNLALVAMPSKMRLYCLRRVGRVCVRVLHVVCPKRQPHKKETGAAARCIAFSLKPTLE